MFHNSIIKIQVYIVFQGFLLSFVNIVFKIVQKKINSCYNGNVSN